MDAEIRILESKEIASWFKKQGFETAKFNSKVEYITTRYLEQLISFKLKKRKDHTTFYKVGFGGSLLVFECSIENNKINYECYAPIWLFGIWNKKLKFK